MVTDAMVEAATKALIDGMFRPKDLPLGQYSVDKFRQIMRAALEAAESTRSHPMDTNQLRGILERCKTVLGNMALENEGPIRIIRRWQISDEPLRNDAMNLLPLVDEALG